MNRILTASEHLMWLSYRNSPENVTLSATIKGSFTIDLLTEALAWLKLRHSRLKVKIVTLHQNQPQFSLENVPPIPLRVIERRGEEHWCREMVEELLYPLSWSEEPLLRVLLLHSSDVSNLIITFHHCIGDGLSGAYLIRDILQFIGEPDSPRELLPDLPPVDEIIPDITRNWVEEDLDNSIKAESILTATYRNNHEVNSSETFPLRLFHWTLSSAETTKLVARCREEKTSVHGALCAAFLLGIAAEIKSQEEIILRCHTPVNIRNYLTIHVGENLGEYITRPVTAHRLSQKTDFWDLAREVKYKLNQVVAEGKLFDDVLKARALLSSNSKKGEETSDARDIGGIDIVITNLGNLNIKQQFGKLQLQEFYLMATGTKSLPLFIGVATLQEKMCFICRYQESLVPGTNAYNIKNIAMEQLLTALVEVG
ncbi:phthiocerol/phthiodiolone dimycocerosyl transferase family protein [Nostoc sp. MG11]|uniref:phthiocerol/phthiodiolone dimycocerosyl transferase family protein n=1 Tax=Nostoc sp. MG11 TaxID=2721166 RepID=UPI001D016A67|nr:condensation domain-containing protein [Nostoc sp. MG11]